MGIETGTEYDGAGCSFTSAIVVVEGRKDIGVMLTSIST
jgi:hypothetical protein